MNYLKAAHIEPHDQQPEAPMTTGFPDRLAEALFVFLVQRVTGGMGNAQRQRDDHQRHGGEHDGGEDPALAGNHVVAQRHDQHLTGGPARDHDRQPERAPFLGRDPADDG